MIAQTGPGTIQQPHQRGGLGASRQHHSPGYAPDAVSLAATLIAAVVCPVPHVDTGPSRTGPFCCSSGDYLAHRWRDDSAPSPEGIPDP